MVTRLDPTFANAFVEYYEKELFLYTSELVLYLHYVDDTFAIGNKKSNCDSFLTALNSSNLCLPFRFEKSWQTPFLDMQLNKADSEFFAFVFFFVTKTDFY